ncbi:MAG: hypothetical protein H3C34_25065, partial [Caldilineaceae bacterium]|nr:hypothetical protein [Caldilineaceae bacterium]
MRRVLFALVVVTLGATLLAGCRAEQEIRRAAAFGATAVVPTPAPVPPFDELLRERAAGCSLAGRDAFVAQAERINNAFEDSYLLALSSPRLALTPVVRDMQVFAREMEELAADPCGVIVRDHLVAAY